MALAAAPPAPLEVTIDSYRQLARTAWSRKLDLLVENHGGITADPEVIVALVEGVGRDALKVLVDIDHFEPLLSLQMAAMPGKETPDVAVTPLYDTIAQIAPYAHLVHLKIHGVDAADHPLHVDVVRALRVVRDTGFAGPISLA